MISRQFPQRIDAPPVPRTVEASSKAKAEPVDMVVVVGPGHASSYVAGVRGALEASGCTYRLVGDGQRPVRPEDIESLQRGHLGANTKLFVEAHGRVINGRHMLLLDGRVPTTHFESLVRQPGTGTSGFNGQLVIRSCYLGAQRGRWRPEEQRPGDGPSMYLGSKQKTIYNPPAGGDLPELIRFVGECKQRGRDVSSLDLLSHAANVTGDCVTGVGGGLVGPLVVHAVKLASDVGGAYRETQRAANEHQSPLDAGMPRVQGEPVDVAALAKVIQPADDAQMTRQAADAMFVRASRGTAEQVKSLLLADPSLANVSTPDGRRPLHYAAFTGDVRVIEALVQQGADVDAADVEGVTPLQLAAREGHGEAVRLLCKAGAYVDGANTADITALHAACRAGQLDAAVALLKAGADPCKPTCDGKTPLHYACACGDIALVRLLVDEFHVPIDVRTSDSWAPTPLDEAALSHGPGRARIIEFLGQRLSQERLLTARL